MSNKSTKNLIAIARGKRVKFLRSYIAPMTGQEFADYCGSVRGTVTNWETGKGKTGLTKKGASQIMKAMENIGVHVSLEWLLDGKGNIPRVIDQNKLSRLHYPMPEVHSSKYVGESGICDCNNFLEEVALFKKQYPSHLIHTLQDDSMIPIYYPKDCIGGPRLVPEQFQLLVQSNICIVLLQPGKLLVRRVRLEGSPVEAMSFYGVNAEAALESPPIFRVPIASIIAIAPVTRMWRNVDL